MILSGIIMVTFIYLGEEKVDKIFAQTFGAWMEVAFRVMTFSMMTVDLSTILAVMYRCDCVLADPLSF